MKILLINPPFNRLKGIKEFYYPIGLGYLAAVLKKANYDVLIYNVDAPSKNENIVTYKDAYSMQMETHKLYLKAIENDSHYVWGEVRKVLKKFNPNIIAITSSSAKFQSAVKVSQIFKDFNKDGVVIAGGPHPTICPEDTIKNKFIDFVVRGEGEKTIVELCDSIKNKRRNFSKIDGITYKKKDKIIHNQERLLIENLDDLPFPERKAIVFPKRYSSQMFGALVGLRGCPFRCAFCAAKCTWTRKVRQRSATNIIAEIKWVMNNFGTNEFFFWDDSFTIDRKKIVELCQRIIKNRLGISWGCCTKVTLLDEGLIKLMKKAGCGSIELGVESGSERILKIIKKDITIPQVKNAIGLLKKYNISFTLFLMAGFPEETKEDIEQTIKFIREIKSGFMCFSIFTPYPGTELYENALKLNLIPKKIKWEHFSHQSPENSFTKYISKDEFQDYVKKMVNIIDKHNSSLKRKWEYTLAKMGFYIKNPIIFIRRVIDEYNRK